MNGQKGAREALHPPSSRDDFVRETVREFFDLVSEDDELDDGSIAGVGSPANFAQQLYDLWPHSSSWAKVIGPVYTTSQLAKILGVSRQAIGDRVKRNTILGLRTADHYFVYPLFQFQGREVVPGLSEILKLAKGAVDDWTLASWLVAKQPVLGISIAEALRRSVPIPQLLMLTNTALQRWSL